MKATEAPWLSMATKCPTSGALLLVTPPTAAAFVEALIVVEEVVPLVLAVENGLDGGVVKEPFHCICCSVVL